MTHISEEVFCRDHVEPLLTKHFGVDAWESQKWLDKTGCFCDYWVDLGVFIAAIEVENDEDAVRPGVAQALEYAQNHEKAVPMVITPRGHVEKAQVQELRSVCPIIEVDTE